MVVRLFLFLESVLGLCWSRTFGLGQRRKCRNVVWSCVDGSAVSFSEFFRGVAGSLVEVVAEGGSVPETAGEGCFCDGAGGGAEKLGGHLEAVFQ